MQNWMSFGKVAHDLVMRMQRIDVNNYPEVSHHPFLQQRGNSSFNGLYFTNGLLLLCLDITSYVHSKCWWWIQVSVELA